MVRPVRHIRGTIRARAFTLVELLVVLGMVAVLTGLLLPALARARETAGQVRCAANLRQWAAAALNYANDNDGFLPRRGQGVQPTAIINRPSDWFNALPLAMDMEPYSTRLSSGSAPRPGDNSIWMCPAAVDAGQKYFFAYAMNMRLSTWNAPLPDRMTRIGSLSTVVFMADGPGAYCSVLPSAADYSPTPRHHGRLNIAFLDGHVAAYSGAEIGCGVGDPQRQDVRWIIPYSMWNGPAGSSTQ